MAWVILFIAGLFEICWAIGLKYSDGFSKLVPSIFTLVTMSIGFYLLAMAMKSLPVGTAYAVWTGIGAVGIFILGVIVFKEPLSLMRVASAALIVCGIVGLKIAG